MSILGINKYCHINNAVLYKKNDNIISFSGKPDEFAQIFTKDFFNALLKEGIPCAYTNKTLIHQQDYKVLSMLKEMHYPLDIPIDYLTKYKQSLGKTEKQVLNILENENKKHPNFDIKAFFIKRAKKAEKNIRKKQAEILTNIGTIAKALPQKEFTSVQIMIKYYLGKLFGELIGTKIKPTPNNIKEEIEVAGITNKTIKEQMIKEADKMPRNDSVDSYIIQKANNSENSQQILLGILKPSTSTQEHIHPQVRHKEEALINGGDKQFMVAVLTTEAINNEKRDMSFDDFVNISKYPIPKNMRKHAKRLIEIYEKWKNENHKYKNLLADYIFVFKYESERRYPLIKINIDKLTGTMSEKEIKNREYTAKKRLGIV